MSYYYRSPYVSTIPYRREYSYEYTTEVVPTTSYEIRRRPYYSSYYPEYTTLTSPSIYSPRLYSTTPAASRTIIRSGPYGVTTRTYRY